MPVKSIASAQGANSRERSFCRISPGLWWVTGDLFPDFGALEGGRGDVPPEGGSGVCVVHGIETCNSFFVHAQITRLEACLVSIKG